MADSDDDEPKLSEHALAALSEFYTEQAIESSHSRSLKENWQLSQFWYDDTTAMVLAEEAVRASEGGRVACISCPTLFLKLKSTFPDQCSCSLLEYDRRFDVHDQFFFYDYNDPLNLSSRLEANAFDLVVADPPFLSDECLVKMSKTIRHLAKNRILLCTGLVMEELAAKLLDVKPCKYVPRHCNNLGNEFRCYTNYHSQLDDNVD
jgi:hypothetical protein